MKKGDTVIYKLYKKDPHEYRYTPGKMYKIQSETETHFFVLSDTEISNVFFFKETFLNYFTPLKSTRKEKLLKIYSTL